MLRLRLSIQVVTHSAWRERRNIRSCVARVPADARQRGGQRGGDGRCDRVSDCGTQRVMAAQDRTLGSLGATACMNHLPGCYECT